MITVDTCKVKIISHFLDSINIYLLDSATPPVARRDGNARTEDATVASRQDIIYVDSDFAGKLPGARRRLRPVRLIF